MIDTPLNMITFKIWFRELGQKQSQTFGIAMIRVRDIIESHHFTYKAKCSVTAGDILLGSLAVNLELGTRGLHFGRDFIEAITFNKENRLDHDDMELITNLRQNIKTNFTPRCCNHDSNDGQSSNGSNNKSNENEQTAGQSTLHVTDQRQQSHERANNNDTDEQIVNVENRLTSGTEQATLLQGLLYIGSIFNLKSQSFEDETKVNTFMVIRAFWGDESPLVTGNCEQNIFNFLELFPIMCNDEFFDRTRNKFLDLEMWQRQHDNDEQLIGTTRLPLHQFYIAFRDAAMLNHLSKVKVHISIVFTY